MGSGPAARFDWNLKNKDLNERREAKEASGRVSHPGEHMLGKDKRNRKRAGASVGAAPVGESRAPARPGCVPSCTSEDPLPGPMT